MDAWAANAVSLFLVYGALLWLGFGLLWRVGSWQLSQTYLLNVTEGLRIGAEAPEIAGYADGQDMHLSFEGGETFVVFGTNGCEPCAQLLEAAARHPATRHLRRVYVSDSDHVAGDPELLRSWETYRFHDEQLTRKAWRAPVSPYFHLVDADGRVVMKGVANHPQHLDRLLTLRPPGVRSLRELALSEPLATGSEERE